jgi:DNA sulfur modification protein DndD
MAEGIIDGLFPEGIRNYIWFQGESLDSLINLRDKKTLEAAVQHISYYPYYQKLSEIISLSCAKLTTLEAKKKKEANKHNLALTALITEIESLQRGINREESTKKEIENNIRIIEASLAEDETRYSGFSRFTELVAKYKNLELEINKLNNEMSNYDTKQRELLPNLWILRGIDPMIEECRTLIKGYNEEINSVPERKYLDDPGRDRLEEILSSGQCFVCGAPVHEGNEQYNWIIKRLHDQEEYLREKADFQANMQFMAQFHVFFGKISEFPEHLRIPLETIDKQWQESERAIERIRVVRNKKLEEFRKLQDKLDDVKSKFGVDPVKQNEEASQVEGTIKATRRNLEIQKNRLSACNSTLAGYRASLREKEKEQEKLGAKDASIQNVPETEWKNISIFLEDICGRVQENARKELLRKIESKANEFYQKFTEHDRGYKGKVVIDNDYNIEYEAGLNTSHNDRKKMSVINALLYLNQEALGTYYPFISDAPTSSFDYTTTHRYLLGIKDVFAQSVILTKDVEIGSDNYKELVSQQKVVRVFELESKLYCDHENPEDYEVSTIIKPLKLYGKYL